MPVLTTSRASTDSEYAVPLRSSFTAVIGGDHTGPLGQTLDALGVPTAHLPSLRNSLNPFKIIASVRALLILIRHGQPQVIHAHSAVAGVIARLAGKIAQRPVVYTVHGFGFKPQAPWLIRTNAWLAEALLAAWTTRMICVSVHERQLAARLPMDATRASVIHNAIADAPWRCQLAASPRIVMVARMAAPKRQDLLIEALALLANQGLHPPTRLLGDGHRLRDILAQWPLVPRVMCLTGLVVLIMTWVVGPQLTRWLRPWLHAGHKH